MDIGVLYGLVAMLGFGLHNSLLQAPSRGLGVNRTLFFRGVMTTLLLFLALLFSLPSSFDYFQLAIAVGVSVLGYFPLALFLKALKTGKVGVVVPIANSFAVFAVLFSFLLFGESLALLQLVAISLIVVGIALLSLNFQDLRSSAIFNPLSGVLLALGASILWALFYVLSKIPVSFFGPILPALIGEVVILVITAGVMARERQGFGGPGKHARGIFLLASLAVAAALAFNQGIKGSMVSLVVGVTAASPLVSVVYSRVFYGEKLSGQQYLAVALTVVGLVLVALA